jgi:hypothetical protein
MPQKRRNHYQKQISAIDGYAEPAMQWEQKLAIDGYAKSEMQQKQNFAIGN